MTVEVTQKEEVLKAIELFILQRDKRSKDRASWTISQEGSWTLTQLHIVSLIRRYPSVSNNAFLSKELGLSKPAITKAVGLLLKKGMIDSAKKEDDQKAVYYSLTEAGERLAHIHDELHLKAQERYSQLLSSFSGDELGVILRFISEWTKQMEEENWNV